ncbi:MAG: hypothetical protein K6E29_03445 [Cyanobacteria bacterium RUI128]|nr:hypothetical protein [Cyanobacteria bacterium RUI128]
MRISNQPMFINKNNQVGGNGVCYPYSSRRLEKDTFTPSFTAMKKSQFSNFDFAVVEKFKAPIETFDSISDFWRWAQKEYFRVSSKDYGGRNYDTVLKRESLVCTWDQELNLNNSNYTVPEKLVIMDGITKDMKPNNEALCPVFNKNILDDTLAELREKLVQNKKLTFDFGKMYRANLRKMYMEKSSINSDESKWIIIPSKINDPEHFTENVEKLQSLSCHEWCTKNGGARVYLADGDMHIYMEKGKPKIAIRFDEDIVKEVNSELNDYEIPPEYINILSKYMKENDFLTTERVDTVLDNSKIKAVHAGYEVEGFRMPVAEPKPEPEPQPAEEKKGILSKLLALFK